MKGFPFVIRPADSLEELVSRDLSEIPAAPPYIALVRTPAPGKMYVLDQEAPPGEETHAHTGGGCDASYQWRKHALTTPLDSFASAFSHLLRGELNAYQQSLVDEFNAALGPTEHADIHSVSARFKSGATITGRIGKSYTSRPHRFPLSKADEEHTRLSIRPLTRALSSEESETFADLERRLVAGGSAEDFSDLKKQIKEGTVGTVPDAFVGIDWGAKHDVHAESAMRIFNKDLEEITPDERRAGKAINFQLFYGPRKGFLEKYLGFDQVRDGDPQHRPYKSMGTATGRATFLVNQLGVPGTGRLRTDRPNKSNTPQSLPSEE